MLDHHVQEEVIGLRGGQVLGEGQAHGLAPAGLPVHGHADLRRGLRELAHHEGRLVGSQRRQLGREELRDFIPELELVRLQHGHVEAGLEPGEELVALGRVREVFLDADHGTAGDGGEPVKVGRVHLEPEGHGEEEDVVRIHLAADGGAIVFVQRIVVAVAVAEEEHHLVPAVVGVESGERLLHAALEVGGSGAVLDFGKGDGRTLHIFRGRSLEILGEGAGGGRRTHGPDAQAIVRRERTGEAADDLAGLLERLPGLARRGVHQDEDVARAGRSGFQRGLDLPREERLAAAHLIGESGQGAELGDGEFVD